MRSVWLVMVLAGANLTQAHAQPTQDVSALEGSGNKHYELAEYDAAIADFKEAFRVSDEPGFLFNIAQAYRLKGDCREALTFYKNFLRRVPDAPNAAKVRERITAMEQCAAASPPAVIAPTDPPVVVKPSPTPIASPLPSQPPEAQRGWMKWAGIGAVGVGVVGLGAGVKFAFDGRASDDDLRTTCAVSCTSAQALAIDRAGDTANRRAMLSTAIGGVATVAGVVLLVLSRSGEVSPINVAPTDGGATATYSVGF